MKICYFDISVYNYRIYAKIRRACSFLLDLEGEKLLDSGNFQHENSQKTLSKLFSKKVFLKKVV